MDNGTAKERAYSSQPASPRSVNGDKGLYGSDRCLNNYNKYLEEWDQFETKIRDYFTKKDLKKYGSTAKATQSKRAKERRMYGILPQNQPRITMEG